MNTLQVVHGIDVSHHNGIVMWKKKKDEGNEFCFIKATEGTGFVDSKFALNWKSAPAAGLLTGAYHFFHPAQDPVDQVNHFLHTIGAPRPGQLPCVLDWETLDGVVGKLDVAQAKIWLELVEKRTGQTPIIYASPGFLEGLPLTPDLSHYPLWVAHYGVSHPRVPKPWSVYSFWQTSDAGGLDMNVFNGSMTQLAKFARV